MWAHFQNGNPGGWNILLLALRVVESLFLVSLPLSAALLFLRSRWAVVLNVSQLPVRVLCGYSLIPVLTVFAILGERSLPSLPWLLVLFILELLRIGLTAVAVRGKGAAGPLRPGLPSVGRGMGAWMAVVVLTLILGWIHLRPEWPGETASGATVESVLKEVDERLLPEEDRNRQKARTAVAVTWQGEESPGGAEVDTLGRVSLGVAGIPDTLDWAPACGPWNLGPLIRFELALFSRPWSETFGGGAWSEGSIEAVEEWRRLRFVSSDTLSDADLNAPMVRAFQVLIDEMGVPREGLCELYMVLFTARAFLRFEYEELDGRLRVQQIHHQIDMANVRLRPQLDLRYRNEKGVEVLEGLDFSVPLSDLSPTLGQLVGGKHFTRLRLVEHRGNAEVKP